MEKMFEVSKNISILNSEEDLLMLKKDVEEDLKKFDNTKYFTAYFIEIVSNHKTYMKLISFFVDHLNGLCNDILECIKNLRADLDSLGMDFPNALKVYSELLSFLRGSKIISADDLKKFKTNDFFSKSLVLTRRWKQTGDPRISIVLQQEDIDRIL